MIIKESRKGIFKILGIFGDNVMSVKCICSPFMQMDYIFFCWARFEFHQACTNSFMFMPSKSMFQIHCSIKPCSRFMKSLFLFFMALYKYCLSTSKTFVAIFLLWIKFPYYKPYMLFSHTISLQGPHRVTQIVRQICDDVISFINFWHRC